MKRLLVIVLLAHGTLAFAGDEAYSASYSGCMDDSGGVTVEMQDCMGEELAAQDAKLNAAYKALSSGLVPARRQQLTAVQRLWIQYRDANCRFHADPDGGTLAGLSASECVLRETAERAAELERLRQH